VLDDNETSVEAQSQIVETLDIFSLLYRRCDEKEWLTMVTPETWKEFLGNLDIALRATQDKDYAADKGNSQQRPQTSHLPESLKEPPSYADFAAFSNSHYIGGLQQSILAVESLYRTWTAMDGAQLVFSHETGFYDSDSAQHMRHLYKSLDIQLDPQNILPPDHLSLLLGFLSLLVEYSPAQDVNAFIVEHLDWLPLLYTTIQERAPQALWLLALTDVLIRYLGFIQGEAKES